MLQYFRSNAKGMLGKIIVSAIVVVFVLWGAESIVSISSSSGAPVTVNGVKISESQIQRLTNMQQMRLQQQFGADATSLFDNGFIRNSVVQSLVQQQIELTAATDAGLAVSDEEVSKTIYSIPGFQKDGKFDKSTFERAAGQAGFSAQEYLAQVRQQIMANQLKAGISDTAFSLSNEVKVASELENQKRTFSYLTLKAADLKSEVNYTDDDLEFYYQEHKEEFVTEDQVDVNYVVLTEQSVADEVSVSEEELKQAYEKYVKAQQDNVSKNVSHILITDDTNTDGKSAKEFAEELKKRIDAGEDFATLAKEYSQDPGSAENGGSLGVMMKGAFVPEFEKAAEQLTAAGQVTEPVKTDFGYHLIKLDSIKTADVESFDSEKEKLRADLVNEKVQDQLLTLKEEISNIAFSSVGLDEIATTYNLEVKDSGLFSRATSSGIFTQQNAQDAAFSDQVVNQNENSEVISLSDGSLAVMALKQFVAGDYQPLEAVKEQIVESVVTEKSKELASKRSKEIVTALKEGKDLASINVDMSWTEVADSGRDNSEVSKPIVDKAFEMAKPEAEGNTYASLDLGTGDTAVVRLESVVQGSEEDSSEDSVGNFLDSIYSESAYQGWMADKTAEADVKIK
ncbi:SurA N-terminal domain-containing protein [Gynuella sp.]|uniref:SurA N-terminal domain-containing protein n=1 Tax=Gynuella sp. TaxID=2969146 RepID=UPI003D10FFDC